MDDLIEFIIDVAVDAAGSSLFSKLTHRKNGSLARFLLGLTGAGMAGLLCYGITVLLLH